jgi:hypothetical protein
VSDFIAPVERARSLPIKVSLYMELDISKVYGTIVILVPETLRVASTTVSRATDLSTTVAPDTEVASKLVLKVTSNF